MALANGTYPITITATRSDGVTNTYSGNIVIGNDVHTELGTISNTKTLHPLTSDIYVTLGNISRGQSLYAMSTLVDAGSEVNVQIGTITNDQVLYGIVSPVNITLGTVTNDQVLYGITPTITIALNTISNTQTLYPLPQSIVLGTITISLRGITRVIPEDMINLVMRLYNSAQDAQENSGILEEIPSVQSISGVVSVSPSSTGQGNYYMKLYNPADYSYHTFGPVAIV